MCLLGSPDSATAQMNLRVGSVDRALQSLFSFPRRGAALLRPMSARSISLVQIFSFFGRDRLLKRSAHSNATAQMILRVPHPLRLLQRVGSDAPTAPIFLSSDFLNLQAPSSPPF
jgi:hypothetical protein